MQCISYVMQRGIYLYQKQGKGALSLHTFYPSPYFQALEKSIVLPNVLSSGLCHLAAARPEAIKSYSGAKRS